MIGHLPEAEHCVDRRCRGPDPRTVIGTIWVCGTPTWPPSHNEEVWLTTMSIDSFLDELRGLADGLAVGGSQIRAASFRRWWSTSVAGMATGRRSESEQYLALFDSAPVGRVRARLLVPVDPGEDLDAYKSPSPATAYGLLEPGRAVVIAFGETLVFPTGPARVAGRFSPMFDSSTPKR